MKWAWIYPSLGFAKVARRGCTLIRYTLDGSGLGLIERPQKDNNPFGREELSMEIILIHKPLCSSQQKLSKGRLQYELIKFMLK